jgi:hypothetical protein
MEFSWTKILKNSLKKSGMAITMAKYKLGSRDGIEYLNILIFECKNVQIFDIRIWKPGRIFDRSIKI